jgi:hypothetical protein
MLIAPFSLALVILILSLIVARSHHERFAPDLCANAVVGAHLLCCYCRPVPLWRLISQLLDLFRSGCHWPSPPTTGKLELSIGQINFYRLEVNPTEVPQLLSARVSRRKLPEGQADES